MPMGLPKVGGTYKSSQPANFDEELNLAYLITKIPNPKTPTQNKTNGTTQRTNTREIERDETKQNGHNPPNSTPTKETQFERTQNKQPNIN